MVQLPADTATQALRRARRRLSLWKARLAEIHELCAQLDEDRNALTDALLQQLKDKCDHAENAVLRLQQLEWGWQRACDGVEDSFVELDETWRSIQGALSPADPCSPAR